MENDHDPFDLSGGCTLDGMPVPCGFGWRTAQAGASVAFSGSTQTSFWHDGRYYYLGVGVHGNIRYEPQGSREGFGAGTYIGAFSGLNFDFPNQQPMDRNGGQSQGPQNNNCVNFVNQLVKFALGFKDVESPEMVGRYLLAMTFLGAQFPGLPDPHDENLPVLGFKEKLKQGGQNGELYAHVLSHAGAAMIGKSYILGARIELGAAARSFGYNLEVYIGNKKVYTGDDLANAAYDRDYADYIREDRGSVHEAALLDNIAGREVGKYMKAAMIGRLAGNALKSALSFVLCE